MKDGRIEEGDFKKVVQWQMDNPMCSIGFEEDGVSCSIRDFLTGSHRRFRCYAELAQYVLDPANKNNHSASHPAVLAFRSKREL